MKKIYVIIGTTGEYSDRTEWRVCAVLNESRAQELVLKATNRANEIEAEYTHKRSIWWWDIPKRSNEFDPNMEMDYTGTSYFYDEIPLLDDEENPINASA